MKSHPLHFCTGLTLPAPHFLSLNKWSLGLVVLALSFLPAPPTFGQIFSINISGPGGTGTGGTLGTSSIEPILTYTSNNYIDVTVSVDESGPFVMDLPAVGSISNHTGQTWTGFTITLPSLYYENDAEANFDSGWVDYSGDFSTAGQGYSIVGFSGGSVPNNSSFQPIGEVSAAFSGTFTFVETPIVAPEPSAGGLLLFGLLGAIGGRRLRRQGER